MKMAQPVRPRNLQAGLHRSLNFSQERIAPLRAFSVTSFRKNGDNKASGEPSRHIVHDRSVARSNFRRVIDARSFAAPRSGNQANILRAPKLQSSRTGQFVRSRRPGPLRAAIDTRSRLASQKKQPKRSLRQSEQEEGDDLRTSQIEEVYREQREKEMLYPIHYNPVKYGISTLKDTWPSLPIGTTAHIASVTEKLSWMSRRFPNGYEPPCELARRLYQGERLLFSNEQEKNKVIEEAGKLAQERADKLSQRKGDLVELEETDFVSVGQTEREHLIGQLVQGRYTLEIQQAYASPIIGEVRKNLDNNETYRFAGKYTQFLNKLGSLLASGQRVTRS